MTAAGHKSFYCAIDIVVKFFIIQVKTENRVIYSIDAKKVY